MFGDYEKALSGREIVGDTLSRLWRKALTATAALFLAPCCCANGDDPFFVTYTPQMEDSGELEIEKRRVLLENQALGTGSLVGFWSSSMEPVRGGRLNFISTGRRPRMRTPSLPAIVGRTGFDCFPGSTGSIPCCMLNLKISTAPTSPS
jgi:hypothetical protein